MMIKLVAVALILGGAVAGCATHTSTAQRPQTAQQWSQANKLALQKVVADANRNDFPAMLSDWKTIPVPPVGAAAWNTITQDLNTIAAQTAAGDTAGAAATEQKAQVDAAVWEAEAPTGFR